MAIISLREEQVKEPIILAALLALAPAAWPQQPAANLSIFTGDCRVWHQGESTEAEIGQPLFVGDSVRTGKDSRAEVSFEDGTSVRISDNARLLVQQADTLRSLKLLWGKLWAKVARLSSAQSRFEVQTPTAVAGVRGTVFRVEVDPDTATRVAVEEGEVEVFHPRLARRMVRLAARREAFVRIGQDPSDPREYDPAKEQRWERWSKKAFSRLSKILDGTMAAMDKRLKQEESLLESAQRLLASSADAGKANQASVGALKRRMTDSHRQWRMLLARGERSLRQLVALSRRVEDEGDLAALQSQAESARARLEALSERHQSLEARMTESLERLEGEPGAVPEGKVGDGSGYERVASLMASAREAKGKLDALEPELTAVAARLADFIRDLAQIRLIMAEHPILARERFFRLRNDYFAFRQRYRGFAYAEFERTAAALRSAATESSLISRKTDPADPHSGEIARMRSEIGLIGRSYQDVLPKIRQVRLTSKALEKQLLDISGLIQ